MSLIYNIFCHIFLPVSVLTIVFRNNMYYGMVLSYFYKYILWLHKILCQREKIYPLHIINHLQSGHRLPSVLLFNPHPLAVLHDAHQRLALSVPLQFWHGNYLPSLWPAVQLCPAQECVVMVHTLSMLIAGSRIYEAASVLVRWGNTSLGSIPRKAVCQYFCAKPMFDSSRYWFVKSSLQTEVMETFKRDQFVFKVLLLPQVIVR